MIPVSNTTTEIVGNVTGKSSTYTIDPEFFALVMQMLTEMYSNQTLALIREYSCNALDEHIRCGVNRPVRIQTPTLEHPFFEVQDWGSGLSEDELLGLYGIYGLSTKRDTNSLVGSYGIGSKSALCYTNTFWVIGVKNGVQTTAMIFKNTDDVGEITVVDSREVDLPNGVTIRVPVKDRNDFDAECKNFFRFWEPGTVEINAKTPDFFEGEFLTEFKVDAGRVRVEISDKFDKSYVLMGPVAYPIRETSGESIKYLAHIPMGSIAIAPNREQLRYNDKTEILLAEIQKQVNKKILEQATEEINSVSTPADAFRMRDKWKHRIGTYHPLVSRLTFKGKIFPSSFSIPSDSSNASYGLTKFMRFYPNRTHHNAKSVHSVYYSELYTGAVMIRGYSNNSSVSATHKQKIKVWLGENGYSNQAVYLFESIPQDEWLDGVVIVPWAEISAIKLQPGQFGGAKKLITGSWEKYTPGTHAPHYGHYEEITTLDTTKPIIYVSPTESRKYYGSRDAGDRAHLDLGLLPKDAVLLRLTANRTAKFKRDFPMAIHMGDFIQSEYAKWEKSLTSDEKLALSFSQDDRDYLKKIDPKYIPAIKDRAVAEALRVYNTPGLVGRVLVARKSHLTNYQNYSMYAEWENNVAESSNLFADYPMIVGGCGYEHAALYINAVIDSKTI